MSKTSGNVTDLRHLLRLHDELQMANEGQKRIVRPYLVGIAWGFFVGFWLAPIPLLLTLSVFDISPSMGWFSLYILCTVPISFRVGYCRDRQLLKKNALANEVEARERLEAFVDRARTDNSAILDYFESPDSLLDRQTVIEVLTPLDQSSDDGSVIPVERIEFDRSKPSWPVGVCLLILSVVGMIAFPGPGWQKFSVAVVLSAGILYLAWSVPRIRIGCGANLVLFGLIGFVAITERSTFGHLSVFLAVILPGIMIWLWGMITRGSGIKASQCYDLVALVDSKLVRFNTFQQSNSQLIVEVRSRLFLSDLNAVFASGTQFRSGLYPDAVCCRTLSFVIPRRSIKEFILGVLRPLLRKWIAQRLLPRRSTTQVSIDLIWMAPPSSMDFGRHVPWSKIGQFGKIEPIADGPVSRFLDAARNADSLTVQAGVWAITTNSYADSLRDLLVEIHGDARAWEMESHIETAACILDDLGITHRLREYWDTKGRLARLVEKSPTGYGGDDDWEKEVISYGSAAIPPLIEALLEEYQFHHGDMTHGIRIVHLQNAIVRIGAERGKATLRSEVNHALEVPTDRKFYTPGQRQWIQSVAEKIIREWEDK